jgi:glycosyltransferase involved in cell wall biosynthesis
MREQPRVLIVGPYPRQEGKIVGGVEAVIYYLSEGLAARGDLDVHVLTSAPGLTSDQQTQSMSGVNVTAVPLSERFGCLTGFAIDRRRISRAMRRIAPDLVHVHTQTMYPFAALERGYPSVLTPHGVFFKEVELVKGLVRRFQTRLGCLYERNAFRRARHIILLNRYLANTFGHLLGHAKLHFVDNPIDDRFFDLPDNSQPGEILFIGMILERKGLMHLVDAASILKSRGAQFAVKVVGPVRDHEYLGRVKSRVAERGLQDRFDFIGMVTEDEVAERFSRCSMVVLPSFEETAPMAISQAQAAGKPVVATSVGGIPEMIEEGTTGHMVPFGDPQALADAIGRLLADPEKAKTMGRTAKATAESRYRRSAVIEKTLAVYNQALAHAGRKLSL